MLRARVPRFADNFLNRCNYCGERFRVPIEFARKINISICSRGEIEEEEKRVERNNVTEEERFPMSEGTFYEGEKDRGKVERHARDFSLVDWLVEINRRRRNEP